MKVSAVHDDWREIVCCGLENQQIDFKSHQNWEDIGRVGRAKFARHAMALANTQGGYVVVGVSENENGSPNVFTGMTEAEASSFDPSTVGQTINGFADPPVSLDIVRPVVDGRRYVVMVVYPFNDIPHVCSESCEHELQRGGFYIRTPDARSKVAVKSSEIHPLIRRALRNQRQMLGRMLRGILYEDKQQEPQTEPSMEPMLENSRRNALKYLGKKQMLILPCFEAVIVPEMPGREMTIADIRNAVEQLERPAISDIAWSQDSVPSTEIFATNESLCGVMKIRGEACAFWEVYCNGLFYVSVALSGQEPFQGVNWEVLSQTILMTLAAMGDFYTLLSMPDVLLKINIRIQNTENSSLIQLHDSRRGPSSICRIPAIEVSCQRSPADLEGGAASETAVSLCAEICQRFNEPMDFAALAKLRVKFEQAL